VQELSLKDGSFVEIKDKGKSKVLIGKNETSNLLQNQLKTKLQK
jgi:hypothetical protein